MTHNKHTNEDEKKEEERNEEMGIVIVSFCFCFLKKKIILLHTPFFYKNKVFLFAVSK